MSFSSFAHRLGNLFAHRGTHEDIVLLDTAMGSENSGDDIIMDACNRVAREVFGSAQLQHVATHYYDESLERLDGKTSWLCGTNILYTHMESQQQWALPRSHELRDVVLLGVGMFDIGIGDQIDDYSRRFYKRTLSRRFYHSVRDEMTRRRLESIGITNVLNTACPTMWTLTPEAQRRIPVRKAREVLTSITDYCFDPALDRAMLDVLGAQYEKVIIWVQGSHDIDWCLSNIVDLGSYELIGPSLVDLDRVLQTRDVDYVGTRLHAGIRCLNNGVRTLVVAVDNRARQIGADTGLPVIERQEIASGLLEGWINNPTPSCIQVPFEQIERWKRQFC